MDRFGPDEQPVVLCTRPVPVPHGQVAPVFQPLPPAVQAVLIVVGADHHHLLDGGIRRDDPGIHIRHGGERILRTVRNVKGNGQIHIPVGAQDALQRGGDTVRCLRLVDHRADGAEQLLGCFRVIPVLRKVPEHIRKGDIGSVLRLLRPVGGQTHGQGNGGDEGHDHHPEPGPAVVQHMTDAAFCVALPEGQGRGGQNVPSGGQAQQRCGIVLSDVRAQLFQHSLVAGALHIVTGAHEGDPHQRVEPVDRQCDPGQQPGEIVPPGDVGALME